MGRGVGRVWADGEMGVPGLLNWRAGNPPPHPPLPSPPTTLFSLAARHTSDASTDDCFTWPRTPSITHTSLMPPSASVGSSTPSTQPLYCPRPRLAQSTGRVRPRRAWETCRASPAREFGRARCMGMEGVGGGAYASVGQRCWLVATGQNMGQGRH